MVVDSEYMKERFRWWQKSCASSVMWWGKTGKGNDQKKQSERDLDHAKKLHAYRENYADYGIMSDDKWKLGYKWIEHHCNPSTKESHCPRKTISFDFYV